MIARPKPASGLRADDGTVKSQMRARSDVLQGSNPPSVEDETVGLCTPKDWATGFA